MSATVIPDFDAEQAHELAWFTGIVAFLFVVPDWADDARNRATGFRKGRRAPAPMKSGAEPAMVAAKQLQHVVDVSRQYQAHESADGQTISRGARSSLSTA